MNSGIIFLRPEFKEKIWGGTKLRTVFGYDIPYEKTGECWTISANPEGDCYIVSGKYAGKHLSELWEKHKELFGYATGDKFPILTKIIDAEQDLSIQVHPDDEYALEHENNSLGKTECWYVLDCDDDASVVLGHKARNKVELEEMIYQKRWKEFIREIPIHRGDFFQIEPGCVHAIKGGTLILETQQNSDITYRIYDYDRLQNGVPRELHTKKCLDVIMDSHEVNQIQPVVLRDDCYKVTRFVECDYYTVEKFEINNATIIKQPYKFMNVSVIEGIGIIDGIQINKGDSFIIPYKHPDIHFDGKLHMIISYIK